MTTLPQALDIAVAGALTPVEAADLQSHEVTIQRGITQFLEVGNALAAIRDGRLYRATHSSFEAYCSERWNLSHRHINRLVEAAEVVTQLGPIGPKITNESQARAVAPILREHGPGVAAEVVRQAADTGKLTGASIKAAAAGQPPSPPPSPPSSPAPRRKPLPDQFRDAVHDVSKAISRLSRLSQDDRFASHRAALDTRCTGDLGRALVQLDVVHLAVHPIPEPEPLTPEELAQELAAQALEGTDNQQLAIDVLLDALKMVQDATAATSTGATR